MRVSILVALVVLVALGAQAYKIKPQAVRLVGKAEVGSRFWKPHRGVKLSNTAAAFHVSVSEDQCVENDACSYATAYTLDAGDSWTVDRNAKTFCAAAGVVDPITSTVRCLGKQIVEDGDNEVITFEQVEHTVSADGIAATKLEQKVTFAHPNLEPTSLKLGDQTLHIKNKDVYLRNVELQLSNGSAIHAMYSSTDGNKWDFTSVVPFEFGIHTSMHQLGETKVVLVAGSPNNYTQAQSIYLGRSWEKVQNFSIPVPLSTVVGEYYTTIYGGVNGRPGIYAMAIGSGSGKKKTNEKPINVVSFHNRLMGKEDAPANVLNFTEDAINGTEFGDCDVQPFPKGDTPGCHSSSYANVLAFDNETVIVMYDQLLNGWNEATANEGSNVYAMKINLDETRERKEYEKRLAEAERRKKQEQEYEEGRKKSQEEKRERERKVKRDKLRKDKERKAQFLKGDEPNLEAARAAMQEDGEKVIVRTVDMDFLDIEKEVYGTEEL